MNNNNSYRQAALQFIKRFKVTAVTIDVITDIFKDQGYQLVKYNTVNCDNSAYLILEELGLREYSRINKAFTYKNGSIRIVFLDDSLPENDKLYALTHEEGHIFCGHMERSSCSALNVADEREANEFAHYVLNQPIWLKAYNKLLANRKTTYLIVGLILLSILIPSIAGASKTAILKGSSEYVKTMDYYVTESGEKYHLFNCRIINDKNTRKITEDEFNSGKYEPCKICNP